MELKNITSYYPEEMPHGHGVQYFQSEEGQDFYESLNLFTKKYKLCIEPDTGIIRSMAKDGVDIYGSWLFDGKKVVFRIPTQGECVAKAKFKKASLMRDATNVIAPLQDAVDLDMATDEEKAELVAWKTYRVLLNRVDIRKAPDIEWSEAPESEKKTGN
ncbi:MAG: tail fiber assembly protein [Symbiopectobacterium sp.]|uniref:tail fiber assembly protein n=1 Tax=Symbiopectobacterium sp. TaxID=2952789 RepID=UPI003F3A1868